ncbi:3-phytase B [Grifola frondosa]|uniref:3-phytase B n=1 Tax=Grifola frondosa TaxID=5627 RepID=A0A1C7M4T0_GRIFR|nr:3-phytase B [Grifola frondosa]
MPHAMSINELMEGCGKEDILLEPYISDDWMQACGRRSTIRTNVPVILRVYWHELYKDPFPGDGYPISFMSRPHKIGYAEVALLADDPTTRVVLSDVFTTSSSTGFIHRMRIIGVLLVSLAFYAWYAYATLLSRRSDLDRPITSWLDLPENVQRTWAMYSPYFPVEPYQPPQNCEITEVNILQRHGARYPTSGATKSINAALAKLLSVKNFTDPRLAFLEEYTYNLGQNDLVAFGAAQSYDAGREALIRYSHLVSVDNLPFVRASSSDRVVMSAAIGLQDLLPQVRASTHQAYQSSFPKLETIR